MKFRIPKISVPRYTYICHDCGVQEGQVHKFGCGMEDCPFCGHQLLSCDCCYKFLDIDCSEGTWTYRYGLTQEQEEGWLTILTEQGRIPFVAIPVFCRLCGKRVSHRELHEGNMSDEEWEKYIIPELQKEVLCLKCIKKMMRLFPNGWKAVKQEFALGNPKVLPLSIQHQVLERSRRERKQE
jgi:hypothetical protein